MNVLNTQSLSATLDAVSEALFFGQTLPEAQRKSVARWLTGRQGLPGAYANMFAPTDQDRRGIRLFTGEPITTRVGVAHILGEECCRVLRILGVKDVESTRALERALEGLAAQIQAVTQSDIAPGFYCCGRCTVAYWRQVASEPRPERRECLRSGVAQLREWRAADGQWRRFPFFYTSLALTEIGPDIAREEMRHAAARWRRILPRLSRSEESLARRRRAVGERLLAMCDA